MTQITRDQQRAKHAYHAVKQIGADDFKSYKVLVNSLGPNVIRSGLAGALAFMQRYKSAGARDTFGEDLATGFPKDFGVGKNLNAMVTRVTAMDLDTYMVATRECLKLAQWFKRATQAHSPQTRGTHETGH